MQLHVRVLDATSGACNAAPIAGLEVYIWHTDGQGYYSGFGNPGDQRPDVPYAGVPNQNGLNNTDRFCRGAQVTSGEPYLRRTALSAYEGSIQPDEPGNSGLRAKATFEDGVVIAQMQILLDPSASVG